MLSRVRTNPLHTNTQQFATALANRQGRTSPISKDMTYDRSARNDNFFLDLLADKMDVLQRKAQTYYDLGQTEAYEAMQRSWNALHDQYNLLLDSRFTRKSSTTFRTTKGRDADGTRLLRGIQRAMDAADRAMDQAGKVALNSRMRVIDGLRSEIAKKDAQIANCTNKFAALSKKLSALESNSASSLESGQQEIAELVSELDKARAHLGQLQADKDLCQSQVALLQSEVAELSEPSTLQAQAFTASTTPESTAKKLEESARQEQALKVIAERDQLLADIEQARNSIKSLEDKTTESASEADKYKKIAGALLAVLVGGGIAVYYNVYSK